METALPGFLAALGPTAGVVIVVFYFLRHNSEQATVHQKHIDGLVGRVEQIAAGFASAVQEFRLEHRQTFENLMKINRETIQGMGDMSGKVGELGQKVDDLADALAAAKICKTPQKRGLTE